MGGRKCSGSRQTIHFPMRDFPAPCVGVCGKTFTELTGGPKLFYFRLFFFLR